MRDVVLNPTQRMINGLTRLRESVGVTLGPKGQNVLLQPEIGNSTHTKDGVTVALHFDDDDQVALMAARTVITAAREMASKVGDGTTSVIILATELSERLLLLPPNLRRGVINELNILYDAACARIEAKSIPIEATIESLLPVATLACNHQYDLAKLVAETVTAVGANGAVSFQQSPRGDGKHEANVTSGLHFDRGAVHAAFFTDPNAIGTWRQEDCAVFCYNGTLSEARELIPILDGAASSKKNTLIIASDIVGSALATAVSNHRASSYPHSVVAVKAPKMGQRRLDMLTDIAIITGGTVYDPGVHGDLANRDSGQEMHNWLGTAELVSVNAASTSISSSAGVASEIDRIVVELKELALRVDQIERSHIEDRIAKLVGGVGTILVGGRNDAEVKASMFLVEDGISACFAALRKGVIPAGGLAYKWSLQLGRAYNPDSVVKVHAKEIFCAVMEAPLKRLISNAMESGSPGTVTYSLITDMLNEDDDVGYNVLTDEMEDFRMTFMVEPTILAVEALRTSLGCGSILGSTAAAIVKPSPGK